MSPKLNETTDETETSCSSSVLLFSFCPRSTAHNSQKAKDSKPMQSTSNCCASFVVRTDAVELCCYCWNLPLLKRLSCQQYYAVTTSRWTWQQFCPWKWHCYCRSK